MSITTEPTADVSTVHPDTDKAGSLARQLRSLAYMVERHPELYDALSWPFSKTNVPTGEHVRMTLAAFARAGARCGAQVDKGYSDSNLHGDGGYAHVNVTFGPEVSLHVYGARDKVCQRVQVGTETKKVKDPEALAAVPEVEQEVPVYEWRCSEPLLAAPEPKPVVSS